MSLPGRIRARPELAEREAVESGAMRGAGLGRALERLRRDVAIAWGYGGLPEIREALAARTLRRLWRRRRATLYEQELHSLGEHRPPGGIEVRPLTDRDWQPLGRGLTTRAVRRIRRHAIPGNTCLIAWRGARPVGYTWVSEPSVPPEWLSIAIPSDAVYCWALWVDPRERRRGVGSALVRARLDYGCRRGFRRAWRVIYDDNQPALRLHEAISDGRSRPLARFVVVTFLGRVRVRYQPRSGRPVADPWPPRRAEQS